jgi:predicted metal-dependent hydrolase
LDSPKVPEYVLGYLLYHEMLHALFADPDCLSRKRHHTREFFRAESAYPRYESARSFLTRFCRARGR